MKKEKSVNKKTVKKPIKVMVAIPNEGLITQDLAMQLVAMMAESFIDKKYIIDMRFSKVTNIDYNRNVITKLFLQTDNQYLLMMDYDNPCLKNPLDLLSLKKDIMIYPTFMLKTNENQEPVINYNVFLKEGKMYRTQRMTPKKPLMEYDAGGTGCILIKRKVLENLDAPFLSKMKKDGTRDVGSDLWFCERARRKGFEIWAHWDYACKHMKRIDLIDVARMMLRTASLKDLEYQASIKKVIEKK
jgi:hypothetical protein